MLLKIKGILGGLLILASFLFILDFAYVIALNQNSFFIAGLLDLFFWFFAVSFGMVKLFASSIVFLLHLLAPNIIPTMSFGFDFILDALLSFLGDLVVLFTNSVNSGCNFLFRLFIVVCNLFAKNKIPADADKITLYHLIGDVAILPSNVEEKIVLFNREWFSNLTEKLSEWAFSNIKTSRYLFFHDVLGMNVPNIIGGETYTLISRLLGGGNPNWETDPNGNQIVLT